jgi:hypothetical protein
VSGCPVRAMTLKSHDFDFIDGESIQMIVHSAALPILLVGHRLRLSVFHTVAVITTFKCLSSRIR